MKSKLTIENIEEIKKLSNNGVTQKEIGKQFNVSQATIGYQINKNKQHNTNLNTETQEKTKEQIKKEKAKEYRARYIANHSPEYLKERNKIYAKRYKNKKNKPTAKENIRYGGEAKDAIRTHKEQEINKLYKKDKNTAALILYGANGEQLDQLLANTKADILAIDNNPEMSELLRETPNARYTSIENLCLGRNEKRRNALDLDYCGDMTENVENDISLLPNIMMDEGIIWFTFCMRTGIFQKNTNRLNMELFYEIKIIQLLAAKGFLAEKVFTVKYMGKTEDLTTGEEHHQTPMKFYEFRYRKMKPNEIIPLPTTPEFITIEEMQELDKKEIEKEKTLINKLLSWLK